jgi:hypothetical protein
VKFNQYSADFTVFEYDCPAGLAFDERWEVCVWPGSLPEGACQGSSEIAPVPRVRYACPKAEGYYADPENCRWFFACLDHARDGATPLTAYEFRCPFGLVFDEQNLLCQWPWLVDGCGKSGVFAGAYFGEVAFGDAVRRGYAATAGGYEAGGALTGTIVSQGSGSAFVTASDLGVHSGVGITSSGGAIAVQHGTGLATDHGAGRIVLTDENAGSNVVTSTAYVAGARRGSIKYSSTSAAGGFGEQITGSYTAGGKSSQSFGNAGSYNEGRHISSYASLPDSYVSGGRIENSGGLVLGEHVGVHRTGTEFGIRSGGSSVIYGGQTAGISTDSGYAALIKNSGGARNLYSSSVVHGNEGRHLSGSVLSSVPIQTEIKTPNVPLIPVPTLQEPAATQVPIIQPNIVPIATFQQTLVETPQAPVVPVTTFRRPLVTKVPVVQPAPVPVAQAVPVTSYQETVVETPQTPVFPVTAFRRPAITKVPVVQPAAVPVGQAVPVTTYQQTVVETPQAAVVPVTTFRRPAITKVPVVQPAAVPIDQAVPVTPYQQTVFETPQAPIVPVTTFRRPAITKIPVIQPAAVPVAQAVPVTTYQQTIVETPQAPVVPVTTFRRPAITKVPVIQPAAVPVAQAVPVTTYQQTVVETPQAPVVPVTTFRRPAITKVPVVQPAAVPIDQAVPVTPYQQTVFETPQAAVVPVTTFRRPAITKVPVVQPAAVPVAQAVPVTTYQQTVFETPQTPIVPVTTFRRPAITKVPVVQPAAVPVAQAVPVTTYQQTVFETPQAPVVPVTTFRRPAITKVPVVQPAAVPVAQAVPVTTYQQTVVETPDAPVVPVTAFRRPAVAKVPVLQPVTVPVTQTIPVTYQQTILETSQASAVPIVPDVSLVQHVVTTKPPVRTPTVSQTSIVETAPVTTYFEETPVVPAVLTRTKLRPVAYQAPIIPAAKPVVNIHLSIPASTALPIQSKFSERDGDDFTVGGDDGEGHSLQGRPAVSVATNGATGISVPLVRSDVETFGAEVTKNTVPVSTAPVIKTGISFGEYSYSTPPTAIITGGSVPVSSTSSYSPSSYLSSTLAPITLTGNSIPVAPVVKSGTATSDYSYASPATTISVGKAVSVTPVPDVKSHVSFGSYSFSAPAPSVPFATDVKSNVSSVGYSYLSPAPIFTNGVVSVNVAPPLGPNIEVHSVPSVGIVPGDTVPIVNTRVTPTVLYSYPKPSTPFTTGKTSTFRGVSLASGLEPAVFDSSAGLASGLELPSSTVGPVFIDSGVTRKPYATRVGATKLGFVLPTSNIEIDNIHKNGYVSSTIAPSVAVAPDVPISRSYTLNQKTLLSSTVAPIHAVPLVSGDFGARTSYQGDKFAASYLGAVAREGFIPQINLTYGAPPATQYTSGSAFIIPSISDTSRERGRGTPYSEFVSGYVSSTTIPATSTTGANDVYSNTPRSNVFQTHNFVPSTPRPVTYTARVTPQSAKVVLTPAPAVVTAYQFPTVKVAGVTSAPILQSTSSDYKTSEEFGSRIGQSASGTKSTSRTQINYDNENVEALLDKYSGKFGGLLDNNKESFISGVITDDLVGRGRGKVSQSGRGDAFQRGNVHGIGQSDLHDGYSTAGGYSEKGSITAFGTRTGFTTVPTTDIGSSNLGNIEYSTSRGGYVSTTSSPGTGLRGKVRYGLNANIDADGGVGYDTVAVRHEGAKSQSKEAPVVVITRLSDVNPLLIAKLGAQCTCKSNTITLKRPDDYSRGSSSGIQSELVSSTIFDDDIASRSGTYNIPEHIPSAPLPGSNIVTGSSPDIILGLDDETSSTPVRLAPVPVATSRTNEFLKAIGLDETGVTEAPTVFVASSRPHSTLTEVAYTTAKSAEIGSPVPFTKGVRLHTRPQVVSTPLEPHVEVSSAIPSTTNVRSNARLLVPVVSSTTAVPVAETAVPDFRRVATVSGDYPETGFPGSGVDIVGSTRDLGVRIDGGVPGVGSGAAGRAGTGAGRAFDRYGPGGWRGLDETLQGSVDCQRAGLFRHPKYCNKFYACHWDEWKGRYTLHVFNCPVHLAYDSSLGACNWPSKGPTCSDDNLLV